MKKQRSKRSDGLLGPYLGFVGRCETQPQVNTLATVPVSSGSLLSFSPLWNLRTSRFSPSHWKGIVLGHGDLSRASWQEKRVLIFKCFFLFFFNFFIKNYFWLFLRESETVWVGECQRERGRERIPSRLCTTSTEPDVGLRPRKPWDHDLSQNQESDT